MRGKNYFLILGIILVLSMISASFEIGKPDYSINSWYGQGQNIQGWINLSLDNEKTDILFTDSNSNSMRLIDLLKLNSGLDYTCDLVDCSSKYVSSNGQSSKKINVQTSDNEIYYGFKIDEDISEILGIEFNVTLNVQEDESNQIKIDFFDDGSAEAGNTKIGGMRDDSSLTYGCFMDSAAIDSYNLKSGDQYCQEIELEEAPGFVLTTDLKKDEGTLDNVYLTIHKKKKDGGWDQVSYCEITDAIESSYKTVTCDVDYLVTEKEKDYICLEADQGDGTYNLKGYTFTHGCGFYGSPSDNKEKNKAYRIGVLPKKFGAMTNEDIKINGTLSDGNSLTTLMEDYLVERYGSLSCNSKDCIIPIHFEAGVNQNIELHSLELKLKLADGSSLNKNNFYEISKDAGTVSMDSSKVYLDKGNFSVPNDEGNYNFKLNLDGEELFTEKVEVTKITQISSLIPKTTAAIIPTNFRISLDSKANITSYEWNFNDSLTSETTTTNKVTHSFDEIGTYSVTITITDSEGKKSSKTFTISVGSAKNVIDELLYNKQNYLEDIQTEILGYQGFSKKSIESILDLNAIDSKLDILETNYTSLGTNANEYDYQNIASQLVAIELPEYISKTMDSSPITYYPSSSNINLDTLTSITGEDYDYSEESSYKEAVIGWNQLNIQSKVAMQKYSVSYGFEEEPLVNVFEVRITKNTEDPAYLIIEDMENLGFESNYSLSKSGNYYYKEIGDSEIISFYTTSDVDFTDLPLFVSPAVSELNLINTSDVSNIQEEGKEFKWLLFILILIGVVFLGVILYIVLQVWYKKKYENYLFKDKNAYYNMVNYVHREKIQGKSDIEIAKALRKAKWNNEQIRFVMRKYAGKKTGMAEIPIPKVKPEKTAKQIRNMPRRNSMSRRPIKKR